MLIQIIFPFIISFCVCNGIEGKETVYIVNGKKVVNSVSAEFLSFSFDLNSLFTGINKNVSNVFVENLNPAFVRVADLNNQIPFSLNSSLTKWKLLQEWFRKSHFVPIYTINNAASCKLWDPNGLLPFLKINEEMGYSCYWQLLYDCGYKSPSQYKKDLMILKHVLDMYVPSKIIAGNLVSCRNSDSNVLANYAKSLEGIVDAYMWDSDHTLRGFVPVQTPAWIEMPTTKRLGFVSALQWAKQVGQAAKKNYSSVFWHGQFNDVFDNSPIFWVSYFFKRLMGKNVLDVRSNSVIKQEIDVTAFCAKQYSNTMVVSLVNNDNQIFTASIKLTVSHSKIINIQKYVITFKNDGFTYLNGKKLFGYMLGTDLIDSVLENVETYGSLRLTVPVQGIAIFILHDVEVPACGSNVQQIKENTLVPMPKLGSNSHKINLNKTQTKKEIVGSVTGSDEFNRFLENKFKNPQRNDGTRKLDKFSHAHDEHIGLQLINDKIRKKILEQSEARIADSSLNTTNKHLEMPMVKISKKLDKNSNSDQQKYKRFAANSKKGPKNLKKRNRRDIKVDILKRKGNLKTEKFEDLATIKNYERNAGAGVLLEEEVLHSGESYVYETVKFLKHPDTVDLTLEKDGDNYFFENFGNKAKFKNARTKRQSGDQANADPKIPPETVLGSIRKWQNRFNQPLPNIRKRLNSETVSSKRNKKADMRLLKEKMENRKKMGEWIRNRQKKNATRPKRSLLHRNEVSKVLDEKSVTHYVPKMLKDKWKPDDLRLIKKRPSYSIENLNQREFLPALKRKQRKPRNVPLDLHLSENTVDDSVRNKISKSKFYYESSSTTVSNVGYTMAPIILPYKNEVKSDFNKTETSIFVTKVKSENVFKSIVETVKDFIENVYEQISNYFIE